MKPGLHETILSEARECFHRFGFRRTSVDEIASCIGMSKKTLYKHFSSKDEMIRSVICDIMDPLSNQMDSIIDETTPFPEAVKALFAVIQKLSTEISRPMMDDIRMMPEIWRFIEEKRRKVLERFSVLLYRAKDENIVKKELDVELFVKILISTFDTFANPSTLMEMDMTPADFTEAVFSVFIQGIMNQAFSLSLG